MRDLSVQLACIALVLLRVSLLLIPVLDIVLECSALLK